MSFYTEYYQNVIQQPQGFKLVLGGTGLGKTSGIIETIRTNIEVNKRFFYVANRLQLLTELETDLKKAGIGYCLQERDEEIIKKIQNQEFEKLLQDNTIEKYAEQIYKKTNTSIKSIKSIFGFIKENSGLAGSSEGGDFFRERVGLIFSFFRNIIKEASTEKNLKNYNNLVKNTTIKKLFPYLDFKYNPSEKRIFLVSLQKSFYGFFDGKQVINLYKLKNNKENHEQNIIFLDEFDFLENDLLVQICKDTAIEQPFSFVENFYNVMTKYKLSRSRFLENHDKIRTELNDIVEIIAPLKQKYNIPFPEINHFLSTENKLKNTAIFQTRYSIGNHPIYLNFEKTNEKNEKIDAFYLEIAQEHNKANAYALLNVVNQATSAIIRILKEYEFTDPEVNRALIEHCFGTSDKFKRILKQIRQHPYRRIVVGTNDSKLYYNGFGLYEIYSFRYPTDIEEVELKYYSLFSTPESILLHLTKNNLVFGLSATAEINRYVKNFDLSWLKTELNESANLYYDTEILDTEIIKKANQTKLGKRQNEVKVEIVKESISETLNVLIENVIQTNQEFFGKGKQKEYRKKRLVHFFTSLEWIAESKGNNNSNLLFFSSYKHILHIFEKVQEPENEIYYIKNVDNSLKNCYQITFQKRDFIVLFFDASQGKEIAKNDKERNDYYELFWRELPVLVITTYPSAGNGVNLFYYTDKEKQQKKDFANIHLLDSPFYFFNPIDSENDTEQEKSEKIKANIYYLAKLEKNKVITEKEFRIYLKKIRRIEDFNKFYTTTEDGLSNRVATYIQALGRVERVWEKMDNQVIRLEREVYNHLEDFATQEDNWRNFEKNKPYFSQNVGDMFTQIIENKLGREQRQRHYQWEGLKDINERCRTEIQKLLSKLNLVRANKITPEKAKQIRQEWQDLRELALKQSFSKYEENTLLKDYYCTFETDDYDHRNKCLWIQKDTQNIVPYEVNPDSSFYSWTLDAIYQNITNNSVLRGHFDLNHYEQGFSGKGHYFTPYFYQSILAGAIGEEAVKAIFEKENINLSSDEIDNTLFELIDLKVESKAWYIDAKNYSEQTITHFQLDETDYFYHPKLNQENFKGKAQVKLAKINQFHENSSDCKIIYINAFGNSERPTHYYDENFNDIGINFQKAKIIIIQSMLKTGKSVRGDRNYSQDFQHFISELKNN